jgi:ribosome-associated protein
VAADTSALALARAAAQAAEAKGATNLMALDVTGHLALADVFLLASGSSDRQVGAIVDAIEECCYRQDRRARCEGRGGGRWELLDFGDLVVHVFHAEDREFYGLERLWKDCPEVVDLLVGGIPVAVGE